MAYDGRMPDRIDARQVAAIINTTPDTVDLLKDALERAGILVVSCYTYEVRDGKVDLDSFLRAHQPGVIVYDLAPPYDRNFAFLQHLRTTLLSGYRFVLTTVNPKHVATLVGRDEKVYEVIGNDEDLSAIVQAVREALRARDTR